MKNIILSGINLFEGGPLSIYYDFLDSIAENKLYEEFSFTLFVHKKELFLKFDNIFKIIELPKARRNYLYRLFYEYIYSLRNDIDIWISLQDITPNVKVKKLYTYCHNPSPFLEKNIRNFKFSIKETMFTYFYKYLYRINIGKNKNVIVQQGWIREKFEDMFKIKNVIVSYPIVQNSYRFKNSLQNRNYKKFIYPAFPRFFKNFEIICESCKLIDDLDYEVILTINGTENSYSKYIYEKYKHVKRIKWIGIQNRKKLFELFEDVDCMIFPSKIETWGLPVTEFKMTNKEIIIIDHPYAHETIGNYSKVRYFNGNDVNELVKLMRDTISDNISHSKNKEIKVSEPFVIGWKMLLDRILYDVE